MTDDWMRPGRKCAPMRAADANRTPVPIPHVLTAATTMTMAFMDGVNACLAGVSSGCNPYDATLASVSNAEWAKGFAYQQANGGTQGTLLSVMGAY